MVNLLPIPEKINIRRLYKSRLLIVGLFFFTMAVVFGAVALSPALVASFVKEKEAIERLTVVSQIVSAEEKKNLKENVSATNKKISLLRGSGSANMFIYEAIEKITARKHADVTLNTFFYENTPASPRGVAMTVYGISKDRQTLLAFVNELKKEAAFSDVELPVSNFVKSRDIPFSVSLQFNITDNENGE